LVPLPRAGSKLTRPAAIARQAAAARKGAPGLARLCPRSSLEEWATGHARLRHRFVHAAIPLARTSIRLAPSRRLKRLAWQSVPHLWGHRHDYVIVTDTGVTIEGTTGDTFGALLYFTNVWEPRVTRWLRAKLRPGDVFVDVGAHVGYFALAAARLVGPSGAVIAVEPSAAAFDRLRTNIERNASRNVRALRVAALDRDAEVELWSDPLNTGATTTVDSGHLSFRHGERVTAAPLHALLTADEARRARVIKIDVEGSEAAVVDGMAPVLATGRRDLDVLVELHPDRLAQLGTSTAAIFDRFERAGFRAYRLGPRGTEVPVERVDQEPAATEQIVFSRRLARG
jgi:FkbM family methyltransferase